MNRSDWSYFGPKQSFVTEFDLICHRTHIAALISSLCYIGGAIGCSVSGIASDRFGRKPVLIISSVISTASLFASGFITHEWQLMAMNLIRGIGAYPVFTCSSLYISELATQRRRALYISGLFVGASFSYFSIDLISFFVDNWKHLSIYLSLPVVPIIFVLFFLPESPRWLTMQEKYSEAEQVMSKMISKPLSAIRIRPLSTTTTTTGKKYTFRDFCRNRTGLKILSIASIEWFLMCFVLFSVALETPNLGGSMNQAFALSVAGGFISTIPNPYLVNNFGRRKTVVCFFLIASILVGSLGLIPTSHPYRYTINTVVIVIVAFSTVSVNSAIFVWTTELFPTVFRSRCLFICVLCDRVGLVMVPFITRSLQYINQKLPFYIIATAAIAGSAFGLLLPETRGQETKETYEDFCRQTTDTPFKGELNCAYDNEMATIENNAI